MLVKKYTVIWITWFVCFKRTTKKQHSSTEGFPWKASFIGGKTCESQCMLNSGVWVKKQKNKTKKQPDNGSHKVYKLQCALSTMCVRECKLVLMRQMPGNFKCTALLWFISGISKELLLFSPLKKNQTQTQEWREGNKASYFCHYFTHDLESRFLVHFVFLLGLFQGFERY